MYVFKCVYIHNYRCAYTYIYAHAYLHACVPMCRKYALSFCTPTAPDYELRPSTCSGTAPRCPNLAETKAPICLLLYASCTHAYHQIKSSLSLYIYICIDISMYIYICTCVYIYTYIYVYVCIDTCIYMWLERDPHGSTCMHVCKSRVKQPKPISSPPLQICGSQLLGPWRARGSLKGAGSATARATGSSCEYSMMACNIRRFCFTLSDHFGGLHQNSHWR